MSELVIKDLSKDFGTTHALSGINLNLKEHKIYGLLGRNGAGKTTMLNIISNRLFPSSGDCLLDGQSVTENEAAQRRIYMMSEANYYPDSMKICDIFHWTKEFYPEFDELYAKKTAEKFGLNLQKKVKGLSTGYTSIFKLVIALAVNAPFVLLDEPVLGLDANHRDLFYRLLLEQYMETSSTFIISTHLIDEVANVIEDVIIIKNGTILYNEPMEQFMTRAYAVSGFINAVDRITAGQKLIGEEILGGLKTAYVMGSAPTALPEGVTVASPDLQKLFIQLTNDTQNA